MPLPFIAKYLRREGGREGGRDDLIVWWFFNPARDISPKRGREGRREGAREGARRRT